MKPPRRAADAGTEPDPGFLLVAVRAQPNARRSGVLGPVADAAGRIRLRIAVTEAPADGRATAAVCVVLAEALGVPPSHVGVRSGGGSREKLLRVEGSASVLAARLTVLLEP